MQNGSLPQSFADLAESSPCSELTRDAIRAKPAQKSGLEAVANYVDSPNFLRRNLISSLTGGPGLWGGRDRFQTLRELLLGQLFREIVLPGYAPTCAEDFSCAFEVSERYPGKARVSDNASGSPRPMISSMCVAMATTHLKQIKPQAAQAAQIKPQATTHLKQISSEI